MHTPSYRIRSTALVAITFALAGCSSSDSGGSLRVLYQDTYCQQPAGLSLLSGIEDVKQLKGKPAPGAPTSEEPAVQAPEKDELLFLVSLGEKSSGGYDLRIPRNTALQNGQTLQLPVETIEPAPGGVQTMQLTSPCLVLAVKEGNYTRVQVKGRPEWAVNLGPDKPD